MSAGITKIAIWCNNSYLEDSFKNQTVTLDIHFVEIGKHSSTPYSLVIIDLSQDLTNISQKLISIYEHAREKKQKLTIMLLHKSTIDTEKNLYFEDLLNKLGSDSPLHRLVIVKDLFQASLLTSDTYLEKYILEAINDRKIIISAKGDSSYFPLTFTDLIESLKKVFFLNGTSGKTFWILGDPIADLEIAYLIKKNLEDSEGQEFEIESNGKSEKNSLDINAFGNRSRALLNWEPKDEFSDVLKSAVKRLSEDRSLLLTRLHQFKEQDKHPKTKKIKKFIQNISGFLYRLKPKKQTKKSVESGREVLKNVFEYTVGIACLIYLGVLLSFIGFSALSLKSLESTVFSLRKGDIISSVKSLKESSFYASIGETSYSFVSPVISFFAPEFHSKNYNLFIFLHYSQTSLENLQQTYQLAEKVYKTIGESSTKQFYTDSSLALRSNLGQLYENLNQIDLLTKSGKLPKVLEKKLASSEEFKNIPKIELQVTELLKSAELIPAILAGDSAKNIIIMFQNSQELRPTGGSIDYLLSLVFDNGRVVSRKLYRSDEIDLLNIGVVTAPPLVRLYTGLEDWKTRDLNYNPDYPQTASNITWFIEKNLKFKPDVILAVTENLISSLLEEDKGIIFNGQNITKESLSLELSKTTPSNLYQQLIDHYLDQVLGHELSLISLGRVVSKQSENSEILFWSSDEFVEKTIINQPYSGAIYPHACNSGLSSVGKCLSETTYFNESNFSQVPIGTKIERKINHSIWLETLQVKHEYSVDYKFIQNIPNLNRDLNQVIQIYAPLNSILQQVTLDDKNISLRSVSSQQDNLLERFQIPISMSLNQPHKLTIQFVSPVQQPNVLPFSYSITEYHQVGRVTPDTQITVYYPESARPAIITAPITTSQNSLNLVLPPKTYTFGVGLTVSDR